MTWRHRKNGQWSAPTIKKRKNGQWVTIGGGGGGGGGEFASPSGWVNPKYLLTGSPPTRSNTVQESSYSSLQSALNSIGPDTRLVLDGGTYSGNYDLPRTDHITIDGNGSTISRSNVDSNALEYNHTGSEYNTFTRPSGTYNTGQTSIDVVDASIFSVGDEICIRDLTQVHPDQPKTTSGMNQGQGMFNVVTGVDTGSDVLTLDEALVNDFDNPNGDLMIARVNWGAEDIRVTNMAIDGNGSKHGTDGLVMPISRLKEFWFDNVDMRNGLEGLWCYECYQIRVHNSTFTNLGGSRAEGASWNGYPCTFQAGTTHVYVTNSESTDSGRYGFQNGSGAGSGRWWPTRNGRIENCYAANCYQRGYDQHPGSFFWEYIDCIARNDGFNRARSDGCYVRGGGVDSPGEYTWYDRQSPRGRLSVNQQHYVNISGTNHVYRLLDKYGGCSKDLDWTDVWAEDSGSVNQFFNFRVDTGTSTVDLDITNVAMNGTWITSSNVGNHYSLSGNGTVDLTINSVTHPTGQSPAEYFSDKYGWASGQL